VCRQGEFEIIIEEKMDAEEYARLMEDFSRRLKTANVGDDPKLHFVINIVADFIYSGLVKEDQTLLGTEIWKYQALAEQIFGGKKKSKDGSTDESEDEKQKNKGCPQRNDILNSIVDLSGTKGLMDLIGMEDVRAKLLEMYSEFLTDDHIYALKMAQGRLPKHVLMYGPGGTGKTEIVKALCKHFGIDMYLITASMVSSSYQGQTAKCIAAIADIPDVAAQVPDRTKNMVVFLDEVDGVFGTGMHPTESQLLAISTFKTMVQEGSGKVKRFPPPFIFSATNNPSVFLKDSALRRRFNLFFYINLPDPVDRLTFLESRYRQIMSRFTDGMEDEAKGGDSLLERTKKSVRGRKELVDIVKYIFQRTAATNRQALNNLMERAFSSMQGGSGGKEKSKRINYLGTKGNESYYEYSLDDKGDKSFYDTLLETKGEVVKHLYTPHFTLEKIKEILVEDDGKFFKPSVCKPELEQYKQFAEDLQSVVDKEKIEQEIKELDNSDLRNPNPVYWNDNMVNEAIEEVEDFFKGQVGQAEISRQRAFAHNLRKQLYTFYTGAFQEKQEQNEQ